jgi:gluconate 2-dehydrogenase alpha chain
VANKKVDVVLVGAGWVSGIMSAELTKAGLTCVALERGSMRGISNWADDHDELRYAIRYEMFQNVANETWTLRHNLAETALPIRQLGSFLPGTGYGGAGIHWNGQTWRFHPRDFTAYTSTVDRYGKAFMPADMQLQDWGITYDELEPYYDKFEYMAGIAGKAGNLKGTQVVGGNVFEGRARASSRSSRRRTPRSGRSSARRRLSSATTRSSRRRRTCRSPTRTRTGSPAAPAPTAASASGSAARSVRRRIRP